MSRWPLLLRILLSLALLLNAADAVAASAMHVTGNPAAVASQSRDAIQGDACHSAGEDLERPAAPTPDCCDDGVCTTCTSVAHAMPPQMVVAAQAWSDAAGSPVAAREHASTPLSRLVRPPIR